MMDDEISAAMLDGVHDANGWMTDIVHPVVAAELLNGLDANGKNGPH